MPGPITTCLLILASIAAVRFALITLGETLNSDVLTLRRQKLARLQGRFIKGVLSFEQYAEEKSRIEQTDRPGERQIPYEPWEKIILKRLQEKDSIKSLAPELLQLDSSIRAFNEVGSSGHAPTPQPLAAPSEFQVTLHLTEYGRAVDKLQEALKTLSTDADRDEVRKRVTIELRHCDKALLELFGSRAA